MLLVTRTDSGTVGQCLNTRKWYHRGAIVWVGDPHDIFSPSFYLNVLNIFTHYKLLSAGKGTPFTVVLTFRHPLGTPWFLFQSYPTYFSLPSHVLTKGFLSSVLWRHPVATSKTAAPSLRCASLGSQGLIWPHESDLDRT